MTRTLLFIAILSTITSCNLSEGDGAPCDCSSGVAIEKEFVLEGNSLPNDLTCVVANTGTYRVIIGAIISSYNRAFGTKVNIESGDDSWQRLEQEIEHWLGGAYVGDCGNLSEGSKIIAFDGLGEHVNIEIKTERVELKLRNGLREQAPFWYQGDVTFSVVVSAGPEKAAGSTSAKNYFTFGTCNDYTSIQ